MNLLSRFSVVFLLAGLATLASFVGWWVHFGDLGPVGTMLGVSSSVFLLIWAWFDQQKMGDVVSSRAFLYGAGSNVVVLVGLVLAAAVYGIARDHDKVWDLTSTHQFSLSTQTVNVLDGLQEPVVIYGFHRSNTGQRLAFEQLTRRVTDASKLVEVVHVDPIREPDMARKYEVVSEMGTVVVVQGDRTERLDTTTDETGLANLIISVSSTDKHRVCWSTGHGEAKSRDSSGMGMGGLVGLLEGQNYEVVDLSLLTKRVGDDCEALVIAAPLVDLLAYERESLAVYLGSGGQVLLLLDVALMPELSAELARYGVIMGDDQVFDLSAENSLMGVDNPSVVVLSGENLAPHPITRSLRAAVVLGMARSVDFDPATPGVRGETLLVTGPEAWGETTLDPEADVIPDPHERVGYVPMAVAVEITDPDAIEVVVEDASPGVPRAEVASRVMPILASLVGVTDPDGFNETSRLREELGATELQILDLLWTVGVTLGVDVPQDSALATQTVGEAVDLMHGLVQQRAGLTLPTSGTTPEYTPTPGGRLVVIGDGDFASGQLAGLGNNKELFLNTIAWLVREEHQLGERPQTEGDSLEATSAEFGVMCLFTVFFIPGAAILLALIAWLRRRSL